MTHICVELISWEEKDFSNSSTNKRYNNEKA